MILLNYVLYAEPLWKNISNINKKDLLAQNKHLLTLLLKLKLTKKQSQTHPVKLLKQNLLLQKLLQKMMLIKKQKKPQTTKASLQNSALFSALPLLRKGLILLHKHAAFKPSHNG